MALAQLMRVKQISRQEAVPHYQTVAQLYHRMGRLEAARQAAILCRKYARFLRGGGFGGRADGMARCRERGCPA